MTWPFSLIFPLVAFLLSMIGTRLLIGFLNQQNILDQPNSRSSHEMPTPRGAGIAVVGILCIIWLSIGILEGPRGVPVVIISGVAIILAGISLIDDIRGLGRILRLAVHSLAVVTVLLTCPFPGPVFGELLPPTLDLIAAGLVWIWFINLFNFMDGSDGIVGVETLAISIGLFVISRKLELDEMSMLLSLVIGAVALGFLRWNWHPAKIFLGDVGSIPLGFVLGWMLLGLAAHGAWGPALILPLYFLGDATLTLARRILSGERFWEAHRQHFYQRAIASGLRHDQVAWIVGVANLFLIMLSIVAVRGLPEAAFLGAVGAVGMLLFLLAKGGPTE